MEAADLRAYIGAILLFPLSFLFGLLTMLSCIFSRKRLPTFFMRSWAKSILAVAGVRLRVEGLEHLRSDRATIYMPNHTSIMDIPILIAALPIDLRFLFKKSLLFIPIIGQAIYFMGMIPIDRARGSRAMVSLEKAGKRVKNGLHLLIFPEGTRSHSGDLQSFKMGGFLLATRESIDILPISVNNTRQLCGRSSFTAKKGVIQMTIHPRIETADYSPGDRKRLAGLIRQKIMAGIKTSNAS